MATISGLFCGLACGGWLALVATSARGQNPEQTPKNTIRNDDLVLGVDMDRGGAISHFSRSGSRFNLINTHDNGRFIQQSYYGDRDGSKWSEQPWRWNPVQGGSWRGKSSTILRSQFAPSSLEVVTQPTHWATGAEITAAEMTTIASLKGRLAHLVYRFDYHGDQQHQATEQEMPAVFVDESLHTLVFYSGSAPWSQAETTRVKPGWPNETYDVAESWAAYVNDDDWGLGLYSPRMRRITCYRYPKAGETVPPGDACSYFAPIEEMAIGPDFSLEYEVWLTIGSLQEIRRSFDVIQRRVDRKASRGSDPEFNR